MRWSVVKLLDIALLVVILASMLTACSRHGLEPATLALIDETEAAWQTAPIANYRVTAEVDRPGERRRAIVTVTDGEIAEGFVSYYNFETRHWGEPQDLNQEQAFAFTVPGLFETVRGALGGCERDGIHVQMDGEPSFPHKIVLGPAIMDGEKIEETQSTVTVSQFDQQ